jgi:hypothetical protein
MGGTYRRHMADEWYLKVLIAKERWEEMRR